MVVDIAPQQQLNEVFTTNRTHQRSSSSTHRRSSTTTSHASSSISSSNNDSSAMTHAQRIATDELNKKAVQILGHATAILGCRRQTSMDFHAQHPPRLNIKESTSSISSRNTTASSTIVHNPPAALPTSNPVSSAGRGRPAVTVEHLVPLILQLVAAPKLMKLPEMITRHPSNSKSVDHVLESRKVALALHRESVVKLSDDENDDDDVDNSEQTYTVLTEITDNRINNNSRNQKNSNDNHPYHSYENQTETQHSGRSQRRCEDDEDSEEEDSDTHEAAHSDAENDDATNETNPNTLSLMDFVRGKDTLVEPAESSSVHSPDSSSNARKRSISPEIKRDHAMPVHTRDDLQNKRQRLLNRRALLKSFVSSVNTKVDYKQPSLPIAIPTHLFVDQPSKPRDEPPVERQQRTSKRYANGSLKHDSSANAPDGLSDSSSSCTAPNAATHQKKNKTSHVQEKPATRPEPPAPTSTTPVKLEPTPVAPVTSAANEADSKARTSVLPTASNTATVSPMISSQPKKEKPTANVKPLQQLAPVEPLSAGHSLGNGINIPDSLTTSNTRANLSATKSNYTKLKQMSKTDLASLARKKKKEADRGKRTTFDEAREAMGLYLESVCYFIQCASDETKQDQRTSLLTTTLTMLHQLAQNHKKMFYLPNASLAGDLSTLQQKFLLINYWLQSLIYYLQFNTNMPTIDRYATQVTEYFNQLKNPSSAASLTRTSNLHSQAQSTPVSDTNPVSPLSTTSQTSSSDASTTSGGGNNNNNPAEQHRCMFDFSKFMLASYHSTQYWNKAESLSREKPLKEFVEQLLKQNQNRRLSRDDTTLDFILYIFDAIELLRLSVA